jgi:hypothetical protein
MSDPKEEYIETSWIAAQRQSKGRGTRKKGEPEIHKPKNPPVFVEEMPENAIISHRGLMLYNVSTDKWVDLNDRRQLKWVDHSIYCAVNNDENVPGEIRDEIFTFICGESGSCILVPAIVWQSVLTGNKRVYYVECDFTKSYAAVKL